MALTYGFFNSVDSDRVYNADQMSKYFKGLVSNGVYMNVGGAYKVTASGDGLSVNVAPGRAIIDCKWAESDAIETVSITAADPSKARYTAITLRLSYGDRLIALGTHDGVAAASPVKPMPVRTSDNYEIILAYVLVPAGATTISQAQVIDMRADSSVCGWVSGLIDQVDVGDLFDQFNTAYQQMLVDMQQWQVAQKAQYEEWFATLTDTLTVGAIDEEYVKVVTYPANSGPGKSIALNGIEGYTAKDGDIINVYINGLMSIEGIDYDLVDISGVKTVVFRTLDVRALPCTVKVQILQSKASAGGGGGGPEILTNYFNTAIIESTSVGEGSTSPNYQSIGG